MGFFSGAEQRFNVCLPSESHCPLSAVLSKRETSCLLTNMWSEVKSVLHLSTNNLESDFVYWNNCQCFNANNVDFNCIMPYKIPSECCIARLLVSLSENTWIPVKTSLWFLPEQIFPAYFLLKKDTVKEGFWEAWDIGKKNC